MRPPTLVVDASIAIKWLLVEQDWRLALKIREMYQEAKLHLIAPQLLLAEVGNVLWKRVRIGELSARDAELLFARLLVDSPALLESDRVKQHALRLAIAHHRTFYDSLYLALALDHDCDLVTADEEFVRAMQPTFSCVKLLGAYVPSPQLER